MKKITYYQCEYCKSKTRDLNKLKSHELKCRDISIVQDVAVRRIAALFHFYEKLGYRISVVHHTDEQSLITVYHPDYGKFK